MNQSNTDSIAAVMPAVIASGLLISLCTITVPPAVFDAGGAPNPNAPYTDLSGHVNIPCISSPLNTGGDQVNPTEIKSLAEILAKQLRHVLLDGYYPDIIADYRATVDGVVYDILAVESDSQHTQTRLAVQIASV